MIAGWAGKVIASAGSMAAPGGSAAGKDAAAKLGGNAVAFYDLEVDLVGRAGHHSALHHHDMVSVLLLERRANLFGRTEHEREINCLPVEWSADGDERELGAQHSGGQIRRRAQALADMPAQKLFQARFEDG